MTVREGSPTASEARGASGGRGRSARRIGLEIVVVAGGGAAAGFLSLALATALPSVAQPLVDAPAGWTLIAALVVWATRRTTLPLVAVYGVVALVALNAGWYVLGGGGGSVYAGFWTAVAVCAGPVVGTAAGWLHHRDARGAVGGGVLCGIVLGDSVISTSLIGNIDAVGGTAMVVVALLLATATAVRVRGLRAKTVVVAATVGTGVAYVLAWQLLVPLL